MSGERESPKLFNHKPKKAKSKSSTPPLEAAASSSNGATAAAAPPPPPPPPQPKKESFIRRYRFLWPLLLAVNFSIGAYVLMRTRQKDTDSSESEIQETTSSTPPSSSVSTAAVTEAPITPPTIKEPIQRAPIPGDQQRELFKWILEEKRKTKPQDPEEKKRIDEEKAILKQFIRAKSLPSL